MAKLTLDPIGNFNSAGIATINENNDKIEAALEKTLSRDGTSPNQMEADLDLNHNDVINIDNLSADTIETDILYVDGSRVIPSVGLIDVDEIFDIISIDEDDMASDTAARLPTQQSVKAYVDAKIVEDKTELADTGAYAESVFVKEQTEERLYKWDDSDLSSEVSDDDVGIFVPPAGEDGSDGSFVMAGAKSTGSFYRDGNNVDPGGVRIHRLMDRVFIGAAATDAYGSTNPSDSTTWLATSGAGFYHERSAHLSVISDRGATGILGATRASDRYTPLGYSLWEASTAISLGAKRGWQGRLYTATVGGTTSSTPPSHTTGTATDGTVTWQFDDFSYTAPIGIDGVALSDVADGSGIWATYAEGVRGPDGGTVFAREIAVKNQADDIVNHPYSMFPGGSTIGDWYAAGGDASVGAPANPSTCAILIGKNDHTWNKGIVFGSTGITGTDGSTGTGVAIAFAKGHRLTWYVSGGLEAANIYSTVSSNNTRSSILLADSAIIFGGNAGIAAQIENGAGAGNSPANYLRLQSFGAGTSPKILAGGSDTNVAVLIQGKGTSGVYLVEGGGQTRMAVNATGIGFFSTTPVAAKTGWSVDTGTAKRTANATYSGTAEVAYTQATIQTLMDAVRDATQTIKALKDDLHQTAGYGLLRT